VQVDAKELMFALEGLARRINDIQETTCTLVCKEPISFENAEAATHLYHIAQEATTNAVKHGKARQIEIRLEEADGMAALSIRDNGTGIDSEKIARTPGTGLRIMRHRASLIGGIFTIEALRDGGTLVTCSVQK
jgi:signal transduction histidine kinase